MGCGVHSGFTLTCHHLSCVMLLMLVPIGDTQGGGFWFWFWLTRAISRQGCVGLGGPESHPNRSSSSARRSCAPCVGAGVCCGVLPVWVWGHKAGGGGDRKGKRASRVFCRKVLRVSAKGSEMPQQREFIEKYSAEHKVDVHTAASAYNN